MKNNLTEFITVESSVISNAWYKPSQGMLVVDYENGSSYEYINVPYFVFEGLRSADSKGKFINTHIKTRFEFKKR